MPDLKAVKQLWENLCKPQGWLAVLPRALFQHLGGRGRESIAGILRIAWIT